MTDSNAAQLNRSRGSHTSSITTPSFGPVCNSGANFTTDHGSEYHYPSASPRNEMYSASQHPGVIMESLIMTPNENDVLYGAPFNTTRHPGNAKYRKLMKAAFHEYQQRNPAARHHVLELILNEINKSGGRFLIFDHSQNGYIIMSKKMAEEKIHIVMEECLKRSLQSQKSNENDSADMEGTTYQEHGNPPGHRLSNNGIHHHNLEDDSHGSPRTKKIRTEPKDVVQTPYSISDPSRAIHRTASDTNHMASQSVGVQFQSASETTDTNGTNYSHHLNSTSNIGSIASNVCDKCQGTGVFPIPSHLNPSWTKDSTRHMDDPSVAASFKAQANSTTNEISSWSQQLKEVESKFGVASDEKMDYPNRIKEIEKIASEQAEQKEKFKMPSILEKEEIEAIARLVEQAEERWGVEVPENFNLAQRIELIEKTAFNFMARLQVWL